MLSQEDQARLAEIERQLLADDPGFVERMRSNRRRWRLDRVTAVLIALWLTALVFAVVTRSLLVLGALLTVLVIEAAWRIHQHRHTLPH